MTTSERLRQRLTKLAENTEDCTTVDYPGPRVQASRTRQIIDDENSGYLYMCATRLWAEEGLDALDAGFVDEAEICAAAADCDYIRALEAACARVRPSDARALRRPAQRRGRPRKINK